MVHDYHEGLPGYSSDQILVDGCGECAARSNQHDRGLYHLDNHNFARALERSIAWDQGNARNVSRTEVPLLRLFSRFRSGVRSMDPSQARRLLGIETLEEV